MLHLSGLSVIKILPENRSKSDFFIAKKSLNDELITGIELKMK
jgi:hypothetical protein